MNIEHFMFDAWLYSKKNKLRWGQGLFNHLCTVRPELAEKIRGTELDPFYRDDRVPVFLEFLEKNW